MGVIAVWFQFLFQFVRCNRNLDPCTPSHHHHYHLQSLSRCADWSGELSVIMLEGCKQSAWRAGDGLDCVILEERLQEHAHCAKHAHEHKDP